MSTYSSMAGKIDCSMLPLYTPSEPSPSYSCEPAFDERRLQLTPRVNRPPPTGSFTKKCGRTTVTLFEQENGIQIPTYGRHGFITGSVFLDDDPHRITQVVMKIEGKLESMISEGGSTSITVLSRRCKLWERRDENVPCPSLLPFSCTLPAAYTYHSSEQPLPPSCNISYSGVPGLYARCRYTVLIIVTRSRHRALDFFLTQSTHVKIPFTYSPRTRSHRPIVSAPCFFSSVKTSPEEWYQVFSEMRMRQKTQLGTIFCHLFIPASRVYSLSDNIPFHIQLNGPLSSLRRLLLPHSDDPTPHESSVTKTTSYEKCPFQSVKPRFKVYILRQTAVEARGQRAIRSHVLGEGEIWEIPPVVSSICEPRDAIHLDWEGEVRCRENITVGGFVAGNITVRDFIVLSLDPPEEGKKSPFLTLQMIVPIKLVTDSWAEVTDYEQPVPTV